MPGLEQDVVSEEAIVLKLENYFFVFLRGHGNLGWRPQHTPAETRLEDEWNMRERGKGVNRENHSAAGVEPAPSSEAVL